MSLGNTAKSGEQETIIRYRRKFFSFSNLQQIALMHWVVTQFFVLCYVTQGTYCIVKQHDRMIRNMVLSVKQENMYKDNLGHTWSSTHSHTTTININ